MEYVFVHTIIITTAARTVTDRDQATTTTLPMVVEVVEVLVTLLVMVVKEAMDAGLTTVVTTLVAMLLIMMGETHTRVAKVVTDEKMDLMLPTMYDKQVVISGVMVLQLGSQQETVEGGHLNGTIRSKAGGTI